MIDSVDSEPATLAAGTVKWFDTAIPSTYKKPILVGYYIMGEGNGFMNVYAAYNTENTGTVAVRNMGTSALTIQIRYFIRHF